MKITDIKVEYLDHMGDDLAVVNAARVSFDKESDWIYKDIEEVDLDSRTVWEYKVSVGLKPEDEKLINYLAAHGHWTPFAHTALKLRIKAPLFVARQAVKHQVGLCLSEDSEITFVKKVNGVSNGTYTKKLSDIADMWFGKVKYQTGKKGKLNVSGSHIRVFNEETQRFETSHIVDVINSGIKDVYRVYDCFGNYLTCTEDHKLLTDRGWVPVNELRQDDCLVRSDRGISFGLTDLKRGSSEDVLIRREYRKRINENSKCEVCNSNQDLEVDHIIPVSSGGSHSFDNLQTLCTKCHKEKTSLELSKLRNSTLLPKYVSVGHIVYKGKQQCYDLSILNIHNFMANGFVVHNCWNEVSRRYVDSEPEFWIPKQFHHRPDKSIKQGSGEQLGEVTNSFVTNLATISSERALFTYTELLNMGLAPEEARMFLPLNTMTEWIWTGNCASWARVCNLRLDGHAQLAIQELAAGIYKHFVEYFPVSAKALVKK